MEAIDLTPILVGLLTLLGTIAVAIQQFRAAVRKAQIEQETAIQKFRQESHVQMAQETTRFHVAQGERISEFYEKLMNQSNLLMDQNTELLKQMTLAQETIGKQDTRLTKMHDELENEKHRAAKLEIRADEHERHKIECEDQLEEALSKIEHLEEQVGN